MRKNYWLLSLLFVAIFFASSCKKEEVKDPNEVAYEAADKSLGGIMYDKFWATEAKFDQANANITKLNASADFFRCKQCHGWDGLGAAGSYINRGPKTTRPNVSGLNLYQLAQTKTYKELFDAMKATAGRRDISYDLSTYDPATNATEGNKMPNYTQLLTDAQIWDIVKFMKEGMFDVTQLYDATYTGSYPTGTASYTNVGKDGNAANGNTFYTANCASCHGSDGKTLTMETMSLGKFLRSKPYEVQHKIQNGQLGSSMVGEFTMTTQQMKDLYKACADNTKYPD